MSVEAYLTSVVLSVVCRILSLAALLSHLEASAASTLAFPLQLPFYPVGCIIPKKLICKLLLQICTE